MADCWGKNFLSCSFASRYFFLSFLPKKIKRSYLLSITSPGFRYSSIVGQRRETYLSFKKPSSHAPLSLDRPFTKSRRDGYCQSDCVMDMLIVVDLSMSLNCSNGVSWPRTVFSLEIRCNRGRVDRGKVI